MDTESESTGVRLIQYTSAAAQLLVSYTNPASTIPQMFIANTAYGAMQLYAEIEAEGRHIFQISGATEGTNLTFAQFM